MDIDGAIGGGSVLRVATGLSIATGEPIHITNIRQQRRKPGLATQHLAGLRAAAAYCNAQLSGDSPGSSEIVFVPGASRCERLDIQIETAGSIGLALQPLIIAVLGTREPLRIDINGGATFGQWAPPLGYLDRVIAPLLMRFGLKLAFKVDRHGFYPQGGARVSCKLTPVDPAPQKRIESRGRLLRIKGSSIAANHLKEARVALRQAQAATNRLLAENLGVRVEVRPGHHDTRCPGSGIVLWAEFENTVLGASALGALGKRSEIVGEEAAEALLGELRSEGTVDAHAADQLIPFIALAGGGFKIPGRTEHVEVNLALLAQMMRGRLQLTEKWLEAQ